MAKQEEQKQKAGPETRQGQPTASGQPPVKTGTKTAPLPPEVETNDVSTTSDEPAVVTNKIRRRQFLIAGLGVTTTAAMLGGWLWTHTPHNAQKNSNAANSDKHVVRWNNAALQAIHHLQVPMPVAARALAIVHTCMYDAWAAYNPIALGTRLGKSLRQSTADQLPENAKQAISQAAYRALLDLFPTEQARFDQLMTSLGYNPSDRSIDIATPAGVGNVAAQAVLSFRHQDNSNQLGDIHPGAYSDYTNYRLVNTANVLKNPGFWQPLTLPDRQTSWQAQQFACAHWANVTPFAIISPLEFMPRPGPPRYPSERYSQQAQQILQYSANLTDEQKVIAEYWSTDPNQAQILERWFAFAQFISLRDGNTLDQNVRLFFSLANAMMDTSIACWATKRAYNSAYPITAVHYLFKGKQIRAWAGTGKDVQQVDGQYWLPYQPFTSIAPAFPEYCSEQSAFSAAAAEILRNSTGSDQLDTSYTQPAHSSTIEFNVPQNSVKLSWSTFSQASDQAGMAGRYSGTHFTQSDLDGRLLGNRVGKQVWLKAQSYINASL